MSEEILDTLIKSIGALSDKVSEIHTILSSSTPSKISVLIQGIALIGLAFSAWQLWLLKRQAKENHDARRRENTISILKDWHSASDSNSRFLAKRMVKNLSKQQKKDLLALKKIEIEESLLPLIHVCVCPRIKKCSSTCNTCDFVYDEELFTNKEETKKRNIITVQDCAIIILRQIVISYLNLLETIASGYRNNTLDRDMIKEQLQYLIDPEENFLAMINDFGLTKELPCIPFMIDNMQEKTKEGKPILGGK